MLMRTRQCGASLDGDTISKSKGTRLLVVISPEHPFESPASRVRAYQLAHQIDGVLPTRILPVRGNESNFTQVHWQLLVNTVKLFAIARRRHGRVVLLV